MVPGYKLDTVCGLYTGCGVCRSPSAEARYRQSHVTKVSHVVNQELYPRTARPRACLRTSLTDLTNRLSSRTPQPIVKPHSSLSPIFPSR